MSEFASKRSRPDASNDRQPIVQAKLRVGAVDDPAEREADLVADRVMAALDATALPPFATNTVDQAAPSVGRIARSPLSGSRGATAVADDTAHRIQRMSGRGAPIPQPIRRSMERAFGTDFSNVRLHQNSESSDLNDELSARAFTAGSDVFLGRGVDTSGREGTRLMAHELTHVVQQGAATVRRSARVDGVIRRDKAKGSGGPKRAALSSITESNHWKNPRDQNHIDGIAAINAADSDGSISKKLYGKHNFQDTAIITSFKTNRAGTFVVVGTFADVGAGRLTYDTAYLSQGVAATGVPGKKYYNPDAPIVDI